MAPNFRILFGIITKSHTELALDEMNGLSDLGYTCGQFEYGANKNISSTIGRLYVVLSNALKLLIKCYKFEPDVIYLNSRLEYVAGTRDFITILLLKLFYPKKVKFLLKSHGSDLEVLLTKRTIYSKIIIPFLIKNISGWLFLSTEEIEWIKSRQLIKKEKLFLVKNIVRIEKFKRENDFKSILGIPKDYKVLLYVGRLIKEKGIHYVVEAFAKIKHQFKTILIIVGDGEEFQSIKEKIVQSELEKNIILTGWVDEKTAAYYTSNSDILIFPTFYPEGFPMVVFNSLAAGLSIITTPTRAAIDYLEEPENCLWVKSQDTLSIETAAHNILSDEVFMNQMSLNNKLKATLFTKKVVAKEISSIVNAVFSNTYNEQFIKVKKNYSNIEVLHS